MVRNAAAAGLLGLICLTPFAGASAQTITIQRSPTDPGAVIRIQINVNFFMAGPTDDSEKAIALRDRGGRTIYEMAARECEVLREKLADDCRLESVNVNINRQQQQFGGQSAEGFQVGGTLGYRITQKSVSP